MDLCRCDRLHYFKMIRDGLITNVLNVFRGRPKLKFKNISDIHEHQSFLSDNDDVEAVRSSIDVMEEGIVKTEPDVLVSDADDGDVQRIHNFDDDDDEDDSFILTLMQIKERCKVRKRKRSQGLASSEIKIEDPTTLEDYMEKQKMEDDPYFIETLTSLRTKLSKNMKTMKKRCVKDHPMSSQEIVLVDQSEEILDSQELSPFSGDLAALVEVKFDCPDNDCFDGLNDCSGKESKEDHPMSSLEIVSVDESDEILNGQEFSPSSGDSTALVEVNFECPESDFFDRPSDFSGRESKEDTEITLEWNLHHELNYKCKDFFYPIPLRVVSPTGMDIVISNSELSSNKSTNFLALDFEDNTHIFDNQLDDDVEIPVSPPEVASPKYLDTLLVDCSKDEYAAGTEVQDKPCSTIEHGHNPDRSLVCRSDDSPEYEEKQTFDSVCDDDIGTQVSAPKVASHEDLDYAEHKGALQFTERTDKNSDSEGLNDITRTPVTNRPKKIRVIPPKPSKSSSNIKGNSKFCNSYRKETYAKCSTLQNCSKSATAFSKQQMHDAKHLAKKLRQQLKSMKDIVDDMLLSEFCLNTSMSDKVNKARMAVKSATNAEEGAKRWLHFMSRDCNRFCKIMKLAESSNPSTPQDVVSPPKEVMRKEKKIAFADEAGGRLCQVRFYKEDEGHLSESCPNPSETKCCFNNMMTFPVYSIDTLYLVKSNFQSLNSSYLYFKNFFHQNRRVVISVTIRRPFLALDLGVNFFCV